MSFSERISRFGLLGASLAFSACAAIQLPWKLPPADATALYTYLSEKDYQSWPTWPNSQPMHQSAFPHGHLVTTLVNPPAARALKKGQWPLPKGSLVVADNYLANQKLASTTVMYKQSDAPSPGGGLVLGSISPRRSIRLEGAPADCVNCHSSKKGNDFLFSGPPG